jgi:hypothetical protein
MSEAGSQVKQAIVVRPAEDGPEISAGVGLQQAIWGYSNIDTVPEQMFVVAKKSGGHVLLAFDGEKTVGFALAFAGIQESGAYLHSHMVGVIAEYQDRGVGRLLKLAQRAAGRDRAALHSQFLWTFVQPFACGIAYRPVGCGVVGAVEARRRSGERSSVEKCKFQCRTYCDSNRHRATAYERGGRGGGDPGPGSSAI